VSIKPGDPKNDGIALGQTYQKMRNTYAPLDKESTNNVFSCFFSTSVYSQVNMNIHQPNILEYQAAID